MERSAKPPKALPKSLAASVGSTALDVGLFTLASFFASGPLLVGLRWLSGALGALANFALNRRWAFACERGAAPTRPLMLQLRRYGLVALAAVSLATLIFGFLLRQISLDVRLLHLSSMAIVWLLFTYPLLSRWVFRP